MVNVAHIKYIYDFHQLKSMHLNHELSQVVQNIPKETIRNTFYGLIQTLPDNYKLSYFYENLNLLTPSKIKAIDTIVSEGLSENLNFSKNKQGQILILEINGNIAGVALFDFQNLRALVTKTKQCGYGKLLYAVGLLVNNQLIHYQSVPEANLFYRALGSVRLSIYNHWEHRISDSDLNQMFKNIRFKNVTYPTLDTTKVHYFNTLGLFKVKDIPTQHGSSDISVNRFDYLPSIS